MLIIWHSDLCATVILLFEVLEDRDDIDDDAKIYMVLEYMSRGPSMTQSADDPAKYIAATGVCDVWPEAAVGTMFRDLCSGECDVLSIF